MESSNQKKSRKKGATGIIIGAGALLAVVGGIVLMNSGGSGTTPPLVITPPVNNGGGDGGLIPEGPITDAEKAACEQVLAMKPQPTSYKDDDGRVWTPCVEWWLGTNIPNWPSGMWPGQLQYLHKPADTAEWLACIAGYLVYKDPLTKAAKETFTDEAATVEITRLLSGRRSVMRSYMAMRMGQLKRVNELNKCFKPGDVVPKPDNNPPPSPDDLTFDLEGNWGGIPLPMREWLAKAELASGIPGLARAAAARWWESFRAKKPVVSTAEAMEIAAANPELARYFINKNDGPAAKKAIDDDILIQKWPKPVDYDGWIEGSFGLGDILGSTFVYSGIHTEGKKANANGLPFVWSESAKKSYQSYEGQIAALVYIVYRVLYGDLKVVVPKIQAPPETQDSKKTWINIFAAYAYPAAFKAKSALYLEAAANYEKRAKEIGIDLAKVAFPWPPGMSYKDWDFSDFWARLQLYAPQKVTHLPGIYDGQANDPNKGFVLQTNAPNKLALQGNVQASIASVIPDGASAPLVIFLHDQDADESQLAGLVPADMVNARLAFLRAPIKSTLGYRWFEGDLGQINAPSLAAQIDAAANVVSAAGQQLVKLYPGTSEVYVVGFGQGGAIAYRLAARGEVAKVLSIAGGLPPALRLADGKTTKTNVWAVHGSNDQVVPLPIDQQTIESFIFKTPSEAKLAIVNGGVHTLQSLQDQVGAALVEML